MRPQVNSDKLHTTITNVKSDNGDNICLTEAPESLYKFHHINPLPIRHAYTDPPHYGYRFGDFVVMCIDSSYLTLPMYYSTKISGIMISPDFIFH